MVDLERPASVLQTSCKCPASVPPASRQAAWYIVQVLSAHPAVAECAVVGARDELKGQVPLKLYVARLGT